MAVQSFGTGTLLSGDLSQMQILARMCLLFFFIYISIRSDKFFCLKNRFFFLWDLFCSNRISNNTQIAQFSKHHLSHFCSWEWAKVKKNLLTTSSSFLAGCM